MKFATLMIVIIMSVCGVKAQSAFVENYNVSYMDMRSGMPSNFVDNMLQDSRGFVWLCNYGGGLLRYDGYGFLSPSVGGNAMTAASHSCRSACEDRHGRLWVAFDDCTQVIDLDTRGQAHLTYKQKDLGYILRQPAVKTCCDSQGNMWIATRAYIYYMAFDGDGHVNSVLKRAYQGNVPDMVLKDIDGDGSVWITIDRGLYRLRPQQGRLVRTEIDKEYSEAGAWFITDIVRAYGHTWLSTNNGLYSRDDATGQMRHYTSSAAGGDGVLSHNFVTCLAPAADGTILAGTLRGVNILDTRTGRVTIWDTHSRINPLSSDFVNCIMLVDKQVWVGTETGGVIRLVPRDLIFKQYAHTAAGTSLSPNSVNAMYVEPDGTLWVGTVDGGLNRKTAHGDTFTHFTTANSALTHNSVSTLAADGDRRLWIGTWGGGVCAMSLDTPGRIEPLVVDVEHSRKTAFIGSLAYDAFNHGMWIGANEGLYFYDLKTSSIVEPFKGCGNIRGCIGSVVEPDGTLWVGCGDGAVEVKLHRKTIGGGKYAPFEYTMHKFKLDKPESSVIEKLDCFLMTRDGTLWLGSNMYGLYRRDKDKNGKPLFRNFTMQDGLANNSVKGLAEDRNGMIWVATNNGLSRLNPKTGAFTNYTVDDGLLSDQFYWNGATCSSDGTIYLGTVKGVIELHGSVSGASRHNGRLRFTRLLVDNQEATAGGDYIEKDISVAGRICVNEWNKSLEIDFSALNFMHEKAGTYSYRLGGFDSDWQQLPPGRHTVRYTSLPAGTYVLEVKYVSADADGHIETASVVIDVTPYLYKRPWFVALVCIALVCMAVYLYRRQVARVRRREADVLLEPIRRTLTDTQEPEMLRRRIQNILDMQNRYRESYRKSASDNDDETVNKTEPFIDRVMRAMEKNYRNSDFGVAGLSAELGIAKPMLAKKLSMETGQTTAKFICNYRLRIARELLLKNTANRSIAEIAFSVGFNDPKYFTRCFTREYGVSPNKCTRE